MRQDECVGNESESLHDLARTRIEIYLAHHHRARARPCNDGAVAIRLQYGLPGPTVLERPTEIVCKASKQIDESGRPQGLRHRCIVRRRPVDERHGEHVLGPESLEPAHTVVPGAFVIVIRRGGGRNDPDRRGESTGLPDAAQIGIAHAPAKLGAALEKQISHTQILRQSRAAWTRWTGKKWKSQRVATSIRPRHPKVGSSANRSLERVSWRTGFRARSWISPIVQGGTKETHGECDRESPGVGPAPLTLRARRLRLAWRGKRRVRRRCGLVPALDPRPSHAAQRCE